MSDRHESWVRGTMGGGQGCKCSAKSEVECGCPDVDWTSQEVYKLRAELEQRTAERDEARREVCYAYGPMVSRRYAKRRGWDCFEKEAKP